MAGKKKPGPKPKGRKTESSKQPFAALPPCLDVKKLGRPSTYDPYYCDLVIGMGAEGKSKAQIAARLGISRQCMNEWEKQHKEFGDATKAAQDLALAWWEDAGQQNMTRQGFNAAAFIFQMKNRFRADYREKTELDVTADHKHHHASEPVSDTHSWAAGLLGSAAKGPAQKSLPN